MGIAFFKYQATGNDFIMIDDRSETFALDNHMLIARLCKRRMGIGADGLILIRNHESADFEMIYYNADGYLTSLCGNGSRCAVMFARQLNIVSDQCTFVTVEGILQASIINDTVKLKLPDVKNIEIHPDYFFLNTGSPHHISYVEDIENYDVFQNGRKIRNGAPYFEKGSNVNFVKSLGDDQIFVRTYERGVEDETLSCGTGVTAAAIIHGLKSTTSPVKVKTLGGDLEISFDKVSETECENIFLKGPAKLVYSGQVEI